MSAIKDRRGLGFQHYATDATGKRLGSVYLCVCVCVCVCVFLSLCFFFISAYCESVVVE